MQAQEAINELNQRLAGLQQGMGTGASGGPNLLADLTDDDLESLCASHTYDLAVSMNRDVQRIMFGEAYRKVFFELKLEAKRVPPFSRIEARRTMDLFEIPGHRQEPLVVH